MNATWRSKFAPLPIEVYTEFVLLETRINDQQYVGEDEL